ncbi:MAG: bifunctional alpha/beta hydrolase/OsmC family protein [Flavobacteriales bacterium]
MSIQKITFQNSNNHSLSARLELPDNQEPHNFAIFAHCFTCNKNLSAIRNISRALNKKGIAVLRFDFTGLGESEGDFVDTNFSSNIEDLIAASDFLTKEYKAPTILVGHSLGGAAVIFAAKLIESIKAVATIGAPSSPDHVQHLFSADLDSIKKEGVSEVNIGGRPFNISNKFIEDIESKSMKTCIKSLRKPILIIHSPQDETVGIQNAKELYQFAHHPKSFVSIDGADHLMTRKKDSEYVGGVISGWVERYIDVPIKEKIVTQHQAAVSLGNSGFTCDIKVGNHLLTADEPESVGGNDFGPSPYEYVSSGLGACTAMTLRMYADRKKWELNKVIVHVNHSKEYARDIEEIETEVGNLSKIDIFKREIELFGNLDEKQRNRLMEIADKCPVHKSLHNSSIIKTQLI